MRGWQLPGLCPMSMSRSARVTSSSVTVALPTPMESVSAAPLDSWHMLEQSGKLLVPYIRAKSWYRKAASLLVRPEV